jgi:tripartite-type tricarboxylate transporter receptor subunit TctC
MSNVGPQFKAGKLRPLGVSSLKPSALAPGLQPIATSGLPGYEATSVNVMFAPAKTPAAVITRLNQEIVRFLLRPEVKERFLGNSQEPVPTTPEELTVRIKSEMSSMGKVIKEAGITGSAE